MADKPRAGALVVVIRAAQAKRTQAAMTPARAKAPRPAWAWPVKAQEPRAESPLAALAARRALAGHSRAEAAGSRAAAVKVRAAMRE